MKTKTFDWSCEHTWKQSAKNTAWCLLGCSIGDFGTILFFQLAKIPFPVLAIMIFTLINCCQVGKSIKLLFKASD